MQEAMPLRVRPVFLILVRILSAQAAIFQEDHRACDVVAKPETAGAKAILAIAWRNPLKFLDGVKATPVVGIPLENGETGGVMLNQIGMAFEKAAIIAFKPRRGYNRKFSRRH
jgi:hypothetical protein